MSDMNTREGRKKNKQQKKETKKNRGWIKKVFISLLMIAVLGVAAGGVTFFAMVKDAPPLDPEQLMFAQTTFVLDENGEQFAELAAGENRVLVHYKDVPKLVENAFIATEDIRFRQHFGIDIRRLFGALLANITGGFGAEGASTITQQVVKNAFLTSEKTISRKVQEQYLAVKLEQQYSKDQILEMYLNAIYFSEGAYGVVAAADTYFGKELSELTIEDAALLAGLPQRPNAYNPFHNPEAAEKRRNIVIGLMARHGKITQEQAEAAKAIPVTSQLNRSTAEGYPFEAFLNQVLSEVEEMEGIEPTDIYTGGLKIYTTLDPAAQTHVEAVLQTDQFIEGYPENEDFQAGVTLIDTKTGEIKAIGGGRQNTGVKRGFNFATNIKKQPGSTIKPILDYGPVIEEKQWSTGHIIVDEPHTYSGGKTPVRNYSRNYEGPVTMRHALTKSLNVPAIKALQAVGTDTAQQFGERLGIPFYGNNGVMTESYGIGGFTEGISTLDLAGAYTAFGNEGIYYEPHTVRKVEFPDGRVIENDSNPTVAMNDYTAYMITDMLKSVIREGTGKIANIPSLHLAGKTGTTNFDQADREKYKIPSGGVPDVWFAGYTTNYTAAVWTGFDNKGENNYLINNDRRLAQQIFKAIMQEVSKDKENTDFKQPASVVRIGIEKETGLLPSEFTPENEIVYELFVKGTEPTEVSNKYQKLSAPEGLTAGYNEDTDQIMVSWSYAQTDDQEVSFEVQASIDGAELVTLDIINEMQYIINQPTPGSTYKIQVVAISDDVPDLRSDPAAAEVVVPIVEPEIPDPADETPPDEEPNPEEPDQGEDDPLDDLVPDVGDVIPPVTND